MKYSYSLPVFVLILLSLCIIPATANSGELLYSIHYNGSLSIVDTGTNGVITNYNIGGPTHAVVDVKANPAGTRVYVSDTTNDKVHIINPSTNAEVGYISLNAPWGMAISNDGNTLYVCMGQDDKVAVVDLRTNTITAYITVGTTPTACALTPDGTKLYVANYDSANVNKIDTSTNTVIGDTPVNSGPCDFAFSKDGLKVFVLADKKSVSNGAIYIYNVNTGEYLGAINMDHINYFGGLDIEPGGGYIWVSDFQTNEITAYSTGDYSKLKDVVLPVAPKYGVFDLRISTNNKIYIGQDNFIRVYDINTGTITANITTVDQVTRIDIFSPCSSPIIGPQPVYLYVHSYYVLRWENVTLSVYDHNGILLDSQQTDNNGGATFNLEPGTLYTLNAYSSALGINTTTTYTTPNSYSGSVQQGITVLPYTSWLNGRSAGGMTTINNSTVVNHTFASGYQDRDIFLRTNTSRTGSVGYINNSFNDLSRLTTQVTFKLYKLNNSTNNYTLDQTAGVNLNTVTNSTWRNFTVLGVDASNKDYYVIAEANNTFYGNVTRNNPANIPWQSLLPGVPAVWHTYLAVIVVVGIFAASVMWMNGIMGLVGAGAAYVFYSLGWLDTVPGAGLGIAGAVIAAIVFYFSRREQNLE